MQVAASTSVVIVMITTVTNNDNNDDGVVPKYIGYSLRHTPNQNQEASISAYSRVFAMCIIGPYPKRSPRLMLPKLFRAAHTVADAPR